MQYSIGFSICSDWYQQNYVKQLLSLFLVNCQPVKLKSQHLLDTKKMSEFNNFLEVMLSHLSKNQFGLTKSKMAFKFSADCINSLAFPHEQASQEKSGRKVISLHSSIETQKRLTQSAIPSQIKFLTYNTWRNVSAG